MGTLALPVLHATVAPGDLLLAWHLDPPLTVLLLLAGAVYLLARQAAARAGRPLPSRWRVLAFFGGLETLAVALMGPPDHGNAARFSVHMVQHTLLILVAAPLLALGQPLQTVLRGLPPRRVRQLAARRRVWHGVSLLTHPIPVFLAAVGPFMLWHYPPLYEAAVRDRWVHELEHASFLVGSFLFWWLLLDPVPRHRRVTPVGKLLFLFATWMATDLVCAAVTLAPRPLYPTYVQAATLWGIDPLADQRLGGAIMWIGGGGLYAALLLGLLVRTVRPREVSREPSRRGIPRRMAFACAVTALGTVPVAFIVLGIVEPARADQARVTFSREDPLVFEQRVAAFVAAHRVGEYEGRPLVAPPPGGEAYLIGRADGWYPVLLLQRGSEYRLLLSAGDVAHGFLLDLGGQRFVARVVPGTVAVLTLRASDSGTYRILCTELCGPGFQDMTGVVVVVDALPAVQRD